MLLGCPLLTEENEHSLVRYIIRPQSDTLLSYLWEIPKLYCVNLFSEWSSIFHIFICISCSNPFHYLVMKASLFWSTDETYLLFKCILITTISKIKYPTLQFLWLWNIFLYLLFLNCNPKGQLNLYLNYICFSSLIA